MAVNAVPESGGFDAGEVLRYFRHRPRTSMFAAPTMIRRLVDCPDDADPTGIRTIIWGGAPMHVADAGARLDDTRNEGEACVDEGGARKSQFVSRSVV
jgi:long-chain acyl-CoA synthetase